MTTKKYNQQFKQDVLAFYATNPAVPIVQICKDFGISDGTFYAWRKETDLVNPVGSNGKSNRNSKAASPASISIEEHRKLQKRNLELEQENYILKRATAYFAKDALPKGNTLSS